MASVKVTAQKQEIPSPPLSASPSPPAAAQLSEDPRVKQLESQVLLFTQQLESKTKELSVTKALLEEQTAQTFSTGKTLKERESLFAQKAQESLVSIRELQELQKQKESSMQAKLDKNDKLMADQRTQIEDQTNKHK